MLIKKIIERLCHVTFVMQPEMDVRGVWVCGDFNGWEQTSYPMERCKDGSFERTIPLKTGQSYRFRYRLANGDWENDWGADDYVANPYGGRDSVVNTD
jgi:1,4-alpha-glucan branching enzyme